MSIDISARRHLLGLYPFGAQLDESLPKLTNAIYVVVKRFINGKWVYLTERMDDRRWQSVDDVWCVDSARALPLYAPDASLSASGTSGTVQFTADASIFTDYMLGYVLRFGGGIGTITDVLGDTMISAEMSSPITRLMPNDPQQRPAQQDSGNWTIGIPVSTVTGLSHLEGQQVAVLADGTVLPPLTVLNGSINLGGCYSNVVVGLGYQVQGQSLYLEPPGPVTAQGRRKTVYSAVLRVQNTPGPFQVGTNKPDASVTGFDQIWDEMTEVTPPIAPSTPVQPVPFYSGDVYADVFDQLGFTMGQVAFQQLLPLPLNVIGVMPSSETGDTPSA